MKILKLKWDSIFFGFKIAMIKGDSIEASEMNDCIKYCKKNNIRLLQFKSNFLKKDNINLAEKYKFKLVDLRIIFQKKNLKKNTINKNINLASNNDINELKELSKNLFNFSRYYYDKNFDKNKINEFYQDWLTKSINGKFDDGVLIYRKFKKILGFLSFRFSKNHGVISLIGTNKKYRREGIATKLVNTLENKLVIKKIDFIKVTTQGRNLPAQNFYQKKKFTTFKIEAYYHLWLKN